LQKKSDCDAARLFAIAAVGRSAISSRCLFSIAPSDQLATLVAISAEHGKPIEKHGLNSHRAPCYGPCQRGPVKTTRLVMKYVPVSLLVLSAAFSVAACGDDDDATSGSGGSSGVGGASSLGGASNTGGKAEAGSSSGGVDQGGAGGATTQAFSFFVTSDVSATGNLGGLKGADLRCQTLAEAAGATTRTFRAYLSADADPDNENMPVNARDRIGTGPWYNSKGVLLAADVEALHALIGDAELFIDEHGQKIPGQWEGSPQPVEHDILTGSNADGTLSPG
jgi:hypothetical protein